MLTVADSRARATIAGIVCYDDVSDQGKAGDDRVADCDTAGAHPGGWICAKGRGLAHAERVEDVGSRSLMIP